jgi:hypothetical protein
MKGEGRLGLVQEVDALLVKAMAQHGQKRLAMRAFLELLSAPCSRLVWARVNP